MMFQKHAIIFFLQGKKYEIIIKCVLFFQICTLGGRTGSALAWHSDGRVYESQWLQQVL